MRREPHPFSGAIYREEEGNRVRVTDERRGKSGLFTWDGQLFPNFSPWGGWGRIVYRFRPYGDNPDECLMQAMLLGPWPKDKPKPAAVPTRFLEADKLWVEAEELGTLAKIFDQDCGNVPHVHAGIKTKRPAYVWYSRYQESIIRNFHRNYEKALGLESSQTDI